MKGLLSIILDESKSFEEYQQQAKKQGYIIKDSWKNAYERYKAVQHIKP